MGFLSGLGRIIQGTAIGSSTDGRTVIIHNWVNLVVLVSMFASHARVIVFALFNINISPHSPIYMLAS